jgi:integrase
MASITKLGRGKQPPRAIDFVDDTDGRRRKRVRLGIVTYDAAIEAKRRIEKLLAAKTLNLDPDQQTIQWVNGVSDTIHQRLARLGLVEPRQPEPTAPPLGKFTRKYVEQRRHDLKPSSIERVEQTIQKLIAFFGSVTHIDAISADEAKDWRSSMLSDGLAEATARLHCRNAKSVFNDAVDRELIARNPFARLKSGAIAANRDCYVTTEDAVAVVQACPDVQWRTLFGLARYAGLRCPSETHGVSWRGVDWDRRRLTVYAPKTNTTRIVPIVPALLTILSDAFDAAPEGADTIITLSRYNLHRNLLAIISRAGIVPWPDLFQTLRRSCETELAKTCPQHAVSAWLGHSMKVSERHYLQMTDDVYELASGDTTKSAAESAAVGSRTAPHDPANDEHQKAENPAVAAENDTTRGNANEADGIRTRNIRIDSPVL